MRNGRLRNAKWSSKHTVGTVEVVGRSGDVLNEGNPKGDVAYTPGGDPHDDNQ
jgi:hypothetical protein